MYSDELIAIKYNRKTGRLVYTDGKRFDTCKLFFNIVCITTNLALVTESTAGNLVKKDGQQGVGFVAKVTWYCNCNLCTGKNPTHPAYGITASGRKAKVGTIAVDRKLIPLGSKVWIDGIGECSADDVGGAIKGKRIDVWVESHEEALRLGVVYHEVKILKSVNRKQ